MAVQALAREFLSSRSAATSVARALRNPVRYRRGQQQLLSPARGRCVCRLAGADPSWIPLCRQGEPLSYAYEEVEGSRGAGRASFLPRDGTSRQARSRAVSTAATDVEEPRAAQGLSGRASAPNQAHDRVPPSELV